MDMSFWNTVLARRRKAEQERKAKQAFTLVAVVSVVCLVATYVATMQRACHEKRKEEGGKEMIYGLGDRDEVTEMRERYRAMVNVLSDLFNCGCWDIEEMFDSENNIEVGEIVKRYVDDVGELPSNNTIYYEAMCDFASERNLEMGEDVDIYTNSCLDTHIYAREGLGADIVEAMETLFGMDAEELVS